MTIANHHHHHHRISAASGTGRGKDTSKEEVIELIKEEIDTKTQAIEKSTDQDLLTAVSHVKSLLLSISGSPDTCGTSVLSMLSIPDLEKLELILAGTNVQFKFESIMKVLLNQDVVVMKRKENLLTLEFQMLIAVTKLLMISQFGSDKGEMSWQGKGSLQHEITQIIKQKARAAGKAEAMVTPDTPMV